MRCEWCQGKAKARRCVRQVRELESDVTTGLQQARHEGESRGMPGSSRVRMERGCKGIVARGALPSDVWWGKRNHNAKEGNVLYRGDRDFEKKGRSIWYEPRCESKCDDIAL